jgi:hypothetical protein
LSAPSPDVAVQTALVQAMGAIRVRQRVLAQTNQLQVVLSAGPSLQVCASELLSACGDYTVACDYLEAMRTEIMDAIDILIVGVGRQLVEQQSGAAPSRRQQPRPPPAG